MDTANMEYQMSLHAWFSQDLTILTKFFMSGKFNNVRSFPMIWLFKKIKNKRIPQINPSYRKCGAKKKKKNTHGNSKIPLECHFLLC